MTAMAAYTAPVDTIPLTRGKVALIDPDYVERITALGPWFAVPKGNTWYAVRNGIPRYMHQVVLPNVVEIDHKNSNGLDNRRENLRSATHQQNCANRPAQNKTGYKGVRFTRGKFEAQITTNGRAQYLGRFVNAEDAAKAYDIAAKETFGEFARTNF